MALDAVGLQQPLRYTVDLKEGLVQQPMSSQLMKGDKKANRVIVRITNGSETVDLSGVGVSGSFIRPPDEAELTLAGNANGNEAVVVLDDLCYAEEGYCEIDVKLTVNGVSRTILALTGYVLAKGKGAYIDVGNVIPNVDDIIAQYAEMKTVTERTLAAAQRAEALAIDASGYAANTGMLGGQPPSYYAKQEDVNQLSQQKVNYADALTLEEIAASNNLSGKVASAEAASQLHKKGSTIKVSTAAEEIPTNTWVKTKDSYYLEKGNYLLVIPFCRDQGGDDEFFERRLGFDTASTYDDEASLSSVGGHWSNAGLGSVVVNVSSAATYNLFLRHNGTETHTIDIRGHFIKL